MSPARPPTYAYVGPGNPDYDRWLADAFAEQAAIKQLTDALYNFLAFRVNRQLASINDPPPEPPKPTFDDLKWLLDQRDQLQHQLEQYEQQMDSDDVPEVMKMGMRMGFVMPLKQSLEQVEKRIGEVQAEIEK